MRDIVSGLVVLALIILGEPLLLGIVLLIAAMIPAGDMALIPAAPSSTSRALGIHGATAVLMIAGAIPLIAGMSWRSP